MPVRTLARISVPRADRAGGGRRSGGPGGPEGERAGGRRCARHKLITGLVAIAVAAIAVSLATSRRRRPPPAPVRRPGSR